MDKNKAPNTEEENLQTSEENTSDPNPLNNDENKPPTGDENNLAQENIKDDLKTEIPEESETPEPSETPPKETEISEEVREEGEETSFQEEETPEAEETFSEETSYQGEETPEAEELSSQAPPRSEIPPSPGLSTTAPTGMGTAAGMGGSKVLYIIIGILSMILVAGGLYVAVNWGSIQKGEPLRPDLDESTQDWTGEKPEEAGKQEGIAIPGFAEMRLKAGQSAQEVSLYNPEQNTSYFVITLTVDGTEIFKSKMIPPGKALYEIELTNTLAPGTYAGVVNYQCFAMDDALSPQNGANMKCSVVVE